MTSATSVRRADPAEFVWDSSSGAAEHVRDVVAAAAEEDGRSPLNEAALLRLRHHGLASAELYLAPAGFALVSSSPGDPRAEPVVDVVVAPSARGQGVGSALAAAVLAEHPAGPLSAWSHGNHPAASALAASTGLTRVRDLWVMRRSLREPLPPVQDVRRVDVRPFVPGRDEDAFLAINAEAFVDHPEQGSMTRADLDERMAEPWFDPAGFFLAEPSDAPPEGVATVESSPLLGFHWTKVHPATGPGRPAFGEVYVVGVSPAAQGHGLGRLLTLTGLHHLAGRGLDEVILYVESDNAPAVAVYERLGFTHAARDTDVMYARR